MDIALFGGSFDPPHIGHVEVVNRVLNTLDIDKLLIIPTFLNPFKSKSHFTPQQRYNLLSKLFDNEKVEISDFEILQNNPTPTINTVKYIKKTINPKNIYLIIGADNLENLHLWQDFQELKTLVTFVVMSRDEKKLKDDIIQFINIHMDVKVNSTYIRDNLELKYIPQKIQQEVKKLWKIE